MAEPHSALGRAVAEEEVSLSPAALESIAGNGRRRTYGRGEMILWTDEGTDSSLLFLAGAARLYRVSEAGKEITLRELVSGDVTAAISGKSYVEATTDDTVVCRLPRRQFLQRVLAHPELRFHFTEHLCGLLLSAYDALEDLSFHGVRTRLVHLLARLARRDRACLTYTREELGHMIRASRQEVTGALAQLRSHGWIEYDNHRPREIRVLNVQALEHVERILENVR